MIDERRTEDGQPEDRDDRTLDMFAPPEPELPGLETAVSNVAEPAKVEQVSLFEDAEWWHSHWGGMPEFVQEDLAPWKSMMVHFSSPEDFRAFQERIGQKLNEKTKMCWYPQAEIGRFADKRWVEAAEKNPVLMARRAKPKPPGCL